MALSPPRKDPVLLLGATGYIGGRLLPRLLEAGYAVRAAARSPEKLTCRAYAAHPGLEIVQADARDRQSLDRAFASCRAAISLVHSEQAGPPGAEQGPLTLAMNIREAASRAGLERLIALLPLESGAGPGLQAALARGDAPAILVRAPIIVDSGSAPFEVLRALTERLPVLLAPRWMRTETRPLAVGDTLAALQGCLEAEGAAGRIVDLCGPDRISFQELTALYAKAAGLPSRPALPLPLGLPRLSASAIHLLTPVPAALARTLVQRLSRPCACPNRSAAEELGLQPRLTCRETMDRALERIKRDAVESCWSDAGSLQTPEWLGCGHAPDTVGRIRRVRYRVLLQADPQAVWPVLTALGGRSGWLFADALWKLRGFLDRLLGGPGLVRGRRTGCSLRAGDALDFWRVLRAEPQAKLTLVAEMKLPGQAVLDFELAGQGPGRSELLLTAAFLPRGLSGLIYWWGLYPLHATLFPRLLRRLARRAGAQCLQGPEPVETEPTASCRFPPNP